MWPNQICSIEWLRNEELGALYWSSGASSPNHWNWASGAHLLKPLVPSPTVYSLLGHLGSRFGFCVYQCKLVLKCASHNTIICQLNFVFSSESFKSRRSGTGQVERKGESGEYINSVFLQSWLPCNVPVRDVSLARDLMLRGRNMVCFVSLDG